jgi:hypothetical protein
MPYDPDNPKEFHRLRESVKYARKQMKPFVKFSMDAKRQMVGAHYGDTSKNDYDRVPVNGMEELANVLSMAIAARNPRVMASTFVEGLVRQARMFEKRLNVLVQEIDLAATFRLAIINAVFGPGIVRIGTTVDPRKRSHGFMHNPRQPYVDNITHANLVLDMSVDHWELQDFMGHRYRRPLDHLQDNPLYNQEAVDQLSSKQYGSQDDQGLEREETLSLGRGQWKEQYRPRVDVYDVWLPESNLVLTMHLDVKVPLRVVPFDGPESGPYLKLSFQDVPGQLWPLAPAYALWDLDDFVNRIYRKIFRQGEREKEVFTYQGEAEDTFERVMRAHDGQSIRSDVSDPVQRVKVGGASPQTIAMAIHAHGLFKRRSGTDVIAGFGQIADTATQEKIVKGSADERVAAMQDRFAEFAKKTVQALAWYEWTEEQREALVYRRIGDSDMVVDELWSPDTREGDFVQYDIDIEPYSMQRQTPADKLQLAFAMYDRTLQAMPLLAAQNVAPDFNGFYEGVSRIANFPELRDMVRFAPSKVDLTGVPMPQGAGRPAPFGQQSRPAAAPQSEDQQLMARILSATGADTVGGAA